MPTTRIDIADADGWRQGDHPIRAYVDAASAIIAPSWPIRTFIARNPLMGLEELPFAEAVHRGRAVLGGRGYLTEEKYREFYREGRITDEDIDRALARANLPSPPNLDDNSLVPGIDLSQVMRLHLIDGLDRPVPFLASGHSAPAHTGDTRRDFALWTLILDKLSESIPHSEERDAGNAAHFPAYGPGTHMDQVLRKVLETDLDERFTTLGKWCDLLTGQRTVEQINEQMIKWCAAFLDEGQAAWAMPGRERGFYRAWRELAVRDWSGRLLGIRHFARQVRALPELPEEALAVSFASLGIPEAQWSEYLAHHLGQMPGWAGYIKWRADNPGSWQAKYPIDLVEYLAVRLFYEAALVQEVCDRTWHIPGNLDDMRRYFRRHPHEYYARRENGRALRGNPNGPRIRPVNKRTVENPWLSEAARLYRDRAVSEKHRQAGILFNLIRALDVSCEKVESLRGSEMAHWVEWVDSLTPEIRAQIWQAAFEEHYQRALLGQLAGRPKDADRPDAAGTQVVFCIDVRSEGFRRHLEELGDYETYGFAGFFGVPATYHPFLSDEEAHLYPAIAKPGVVVVETAEPGQPREVERLAQKARWQGWLRGLLHDIKQNMVAPFALVESIGWLWGSVLAGKTVVPGAFRKLLTRWQEPLEPSVKTTLLLDKVYAPDGGPGGRKEAEGESDRETGCVPSSDLAAGASGLALEEQAQFVESALRTMGTSRRFGRIMLFMGHGGQSENNPHASALNCGAAGGHRGGPSARVLAAMANRPAVRRLLRQRGLLIPDDTWFMAGEHNTTTDQVILFDQWRVPSSHRAEVSRLMDDLAEAGARNAEARYRSLPGAPRHLDRARTLRHAYARSVNWAETRPEWGLAANAAMIIGRRALTQGLDLDNRVFLHSYDYGQDPDGTALEAIMAGPLVVAHWINMEYYFSTVDNDVYGSGSKVTHNVVGQIGVMQGSRSDLRPGLPRQSLMETVDDPRHEPMRLLAVIEAPAVRISAAIHRNPSLKRLLVNEWIRLVALDPETGKVYHYRPDGRWEHDESSAAGASWEIGHRAQGGLS